MASSGVISGVSMRKGLRGIITLFLVVLYLVNLKIDGVEGKKVDQIEEDLALERELKNLNKPALKTIRTKEGDILDCVDFYKQPAFDHPLLKDHKIQMKPTFIPKGEANKISSATDYLQINLKRKGCPKGTVPIRRTSKEDLLRARALSRYLNAPNIKQSKHFPGHFIMEINYEEDTRLHGASAIMNVYNPNAEAMQFTDAEISINDQSDFPSNFIVAGWTVNPNLYGDNRTRFFTLYAGGFWGCYNTLCSGFVQVDRNIYPSSIIEPVSTIGGPQYGIKIYIYQDRNTKNWWFDISQTKDESHNIHIGYWPGSILSSLGNGADSVSWAGYAKAGHDGVGPPMGNGLFPEDQKSCYMKYLKFVDDNYILRNSLNRTNVNVRVDSKKCYDLLYHADYTPNEGNSFRFGGPGGGKCD